MDHHELIGLGAPRGMLTLGNIGWIWLGRYGSVQGMSGAREVYRALGAEQSVGFVESGHFHCNSNDLGRPVRCRALGRLGDAHARVSPGYSGNGSVAARLRG